MLRLIGLTLVPALMLAALLVPASAQPPTHMPPISFLPPQGPEASSAVTVPNFISYPDRARIPSSESNDPVELVDGDDPIDASDNAIHIQAYPLDGVWRGP